MTDTSAETIRKRPGMYIGDTRDGSGLLHMVWEVVANSIDEHLAGRCRRIKVEVQESGAVSVEDDGRGMPVHLVDGISFAERALTTLHTTPTLDGHAPHTHVGKYGLGLFVVCALSSQVELSVHRDGRHWLQRFETGYAVSPLQDIAPTDRTGTRLTFLPDPTVFTGRSLDATLVLERLSELSFLNPTLTLQFVDRRQHVLRQPRGLAGHLEATAHGATIGSLFTFTDTVEDVMIEVAARWSAHDRPSILSFANTERTTAGGTHVQGLLAGLSDGLKRAAPDPCRGRSATARAKALTQDLNALICVRLDDPSYDSPTKSILSTPRVQRIVKGAVAHAFAECVGKEPQLVAHFAAALRRT
jgi:DNA gyrase subunit B